ncbi:MAG: HTTM domain-containing protein [Alphaproteobacteria bacterium]|nr:HTTM domain-containing protein [Alphaproteobacteria bacterium]MCB9696624.1 HTTM domain-containing protein [Alphaproteobacteria bacterium]
MFRALFGLLMCVAAVRLFAYGWVEEQLVAPTFHFLWWPWVPVPGPWGLRALVATQAVAGLLAALSPRPRPFLAVAMACFAWVELLDKALYLNHHVLMGLLGATLVAMPDPRDRTVAPQVTWLLRLQIGLVWFWAGVAKLDGDWLLRAEPLDTWLHALADLPLVGPLLDLPLTASAMSWGGAAYDLAIPFLLLSRRTRPLGMALVVGFHAVVGWLFPIGLFPALMVLGATVFLDPSWPRAWLHPSPAPPPVAADRPSVPARLALAALACALTLIPARGLLEGSEPAWTEQGQRFAWRVLIAEKTGFVELLVHDPDGRTTRITPERHLTPLQHAMMRTQPDMIRDFAQRWCGSGRVVTAESWASLNGRPAQHLVRPEVDLCRPEDELRAAGWIEPLASWPGRTARDM